MSDDTDEDIAQAVQAGSVDDFGVLVERYEAKITRYARRFLSRPDDITDLVQDVFIKAYTNIQSFETEQKFSPWIYRIAHNVFVNELRRKDRQGYAIFDVDTLLPQLPARETADAGSLSAELAAEMETLLAQLKSKYREVLVLFYYQDLSYAEISDVLQIPVTTVGVRIKRGREKIQTLYSEQNK